MPIIIRVRIVDVDGQVGGGTPAIQGALEVNIDLAAEVDSGTEGVGRIMRLLREADKNTLVICLISGGGSALAPG